MNEYVEHVMFEALKVIRKFRNKLQTKDGFEIECKLAQLLSEKACWHCGSRSGLSCPCENDE